MKKKNGIKLPVPGQRIKNLGGIELLVVGVSDRIYLKILSNPTSHYGPIGVPYEVHLNGKMCAYGTDPVYDIPLSPVIFDKRGRRY